MDAISILNYQGSKKSLLDFIHLNTAPLINPNDAVLDIFSGTCSVGYSFKKTNKVFANDSEEYAFVIAKALLAKRSTLDYNKIVSILLLEFSKNFGKQNSAYINLMKQEDELLTYERENELIAFYECVPTIWNTQTLYNNRAGEHSCFELFTTYYSSTYFGIKQAIEIDCLRFALDKFKGDNLFYVALSCLYYAMKQCVFSKDGHMAQPLSLSKNVTRLIKQRRKSILDCFFLKLKEFFSASFIETTFQNKTYNMDFEELLCLPEIQDEVGFIYADPPYTDMQYSRYYHLLNVVTSYDYGDPTLKGESFTKGLYINGRFQSAISTKQKCQHHFNKLIEFSSRYKKNLAISFAYPIHNEQKVDRYVMSIDSLKHACTEYFGAKNVEIVSYNYSHSNNRNSLPKSVLEYLILCHGK